MIRVAVIFESSPFDRKGLFNAVHSRVKGLIGSGECWVDAYCVHSRDNEFTRSVRHTPKTPSADSVQVDGITYRLLWYRFSIIDNILFDRMHCRPLFFRNFVKRAAGSLQGYDVIAAHSYTGGLIAAEASRIYGMPYFVTWHGSDVHSHPVRNPYQAKETRRIMMGAKCNFFVSEALLRASDWLTDGADVRREVLYNGVSEDFVRFDEDDRKELRTLNKIDDGVKVVAFVGNLSAVKNVRVLAQLFKETASRYDGQLKFWVVGDGKLRSAVKSDMYSAGLTNVSFLGNVPAEDMPAVMNCIDVLVLPSFNEGLPLVCLEALRCGANVVGSRVGGIPEIIGEANTAVHGDGFVDAMTSRIVDMLSGDIVQTVPPQMSWSMTSEKELKIISGE